LALAEDDLYVEQIEHPSRSAGTSEPGLMRRGARVSDGTWLRWCCTDLEEDSGMPLTGEYEPSPSDWARKQVELYEATNGKEGAELRGRPVIVLTSVGAKTGKLRKTPLMRVEHDGTYAVVASLGGAPRHPVWYHNLKKNPKVELQDRATKRDYVAREVTGDEKRVWWDRAVDTWPDYATYQTKTDRQIPVFVLEEVGR
jgi:F420H(2)-dependent quinone reductase